MSKPVHGRIDSRPKSATPLHPGAGFPAAHKDSSGLGHHQGALAASILHPLAVDLRWNVSVLKPAGNGEGPEASPGHPASATLEAFLASVRFGNARVHGVERRIVHQRQVWFTFKVVYRSDETREELLAVLVDPLTEEADVVPPWVGGHDMVLDGGAAWDRYPLQRLYRAACARVQQVAAARGMAYARAAQRRLERDMVRLEDYYAGLREEVLEPATRELHRLQAARNRALLWRSLGVTAPGDDGEGSNGDGGPGPMGLAAANALDPAGRGGGDAACSAVSIRARVRQALAALETDRERRVRELQEKYRVRAEVKLIAAAQVWIPRVELRYRLAGAARRDVIFYYDPIRRRCVDFACDTCGAPLTVAYLCAAGDLCCPRCFAPCAGCGRAVCLACAPVRCHVCDALLCGGCSTDCPLTTLEPTLAYAQPASTAAGARQVCPACRSGACPACTGMAAFLVG